MKDAATRDSYGETLVELGAADPRIVVLDAGVSDSTRSKKFGDKFPDRFFNMGIAEADMVCTAAAWPPREKSPSPPVLPVFCWVEPWTRSWSASLIPTPM